MKKILLIEDEETSREVVQVALRRMGYTDITCAVDGEQGLKLLDRMDPAPDLVISDIFMPRVDGIELIQSLVKRRFAGEVILMSGGDPDIVSIAKLFARSGGLSLLAVLLKPLEEHALAQALKEKPQVE